MNMLFEVGKKKRKRTKAKEKDNKKRGQTYTGLYLYSSLDTLATRNRIYKIG